MNILSVSDKIIPFLYSPEILEKIHDVDLVLGCGDLPYYYQEYIAMKLQVPLFFVRGNHDSPIEYSADKDRKGPRGGTDLHCRIVHYDDLIIAGVEGCVWYNGENYQYTQSEMFLNVLKLVPSLLVNRLLHGRYLDVFISHAAPWGIHDKSDRTHRGIKAFNWLIRVFKPKYHFHGHNHVYEIDTITKTKVGNTLVLNTYGYRETKLVI
ncbi:MAG: hypothetical protein HN390_10105 [Anaerolineae bacterium]|nr:hypothetical protein [Anaerolineae bacterium]MBT7188586.1 hypothetical protein [Anaerolineae bacterium]MBT7989947.1 hypothetical protein [Anaerolineae bacterium]